MSILTCARANSIQIAFFAGLCCAVCHGAVAKELFVDATLGNDSVSYADNSSARPWKTINRAANGTSGYCGFDPSCWVEEQAAKAGDVVLIRSGTYLLTRPDSVRYYPILNPANNGAPGSEIVFRAADLTNPPVISYSLDSTGSGPMLGTYQRNYITWDGLVIQEVGARNKGDTGPVTIWQSQNVSLINSDIRAVPVVIPDNHNAIRVDAGAGQSSSNIIIRNNKIGGTGTGCAGASRTNNPHNCAGIMLYYTKNAVIENNEIYNVFTGIYSKGGDNKNLTVRFNEIYGTSIGIRASFTQNSRAYQNVIRDANSSYEGGTSASVGIEYGETVMGCTNIVGDFDSYNNTISGFGTGIRFSGFVDRASGTGHDVKNNIIYNSTAPIRIGAGCESNFSSNFAVDYNSFNSFTAFKTNTADVQLASWRSTFGYDVNSTAADPLFQNFASRDFRLKSGSSLINAGSDHGDLNANLSNSDSITIGAFIKGSETIGRTTISPAFSAPSAPPELTVE